MVRFATCPRVKRYTDKGGVLALESINLYVVGQGDLFARTLAHLLPDMKVNMVARESANMTVSVSYAFSPNNGYCYLRMTDSDVEIHCRDNEGARNAAAIIAQLVRRDEQGQYVLPCGTVEDWPDAQYRAMMLETSGRAWIPMSRIRDYIREMALARMNVFQFHYMENNGCTVQYDGFPDLPGYGEENLKYTKAEVKDMIAFAADLGITVTPLVEILSHATDLAEYAGIACEGDTDKNMFAVCLGKEKTFEVIEKFLAETAEIFPDDVIHIGADEYDMSAVTPYTAYWDKCPHCQKLAAEKGYTTLNELFLYGIQRINRIVNGLGKVMMLWNADMQPGQLPKELDRNMIVHYYRPCSNLGREKLWGLTINGYVEEGFSTLNSYYPQTYMDFDYYVSAEKLSSWTYVNDPLVKQLNRSKVPGSSCCAWERHDHFVRSIPAAILLFADRLWNAFGDPVPYDDAYGKLMTRLLFDGRLPEEMNVFACIGDVLPPLNDERKTYDGMVMVDMDTLKTTRDALQKLADEGMEVAGYYVESLEEAIKEKANKKMADGPLEERIFFKG